MNHKMDLRETYNRIAKDWFKDHQTDDWWITGTDKFISLLKPGATVLDVGCGAGVKSKYLMDHGLRVIGIDLSEEMIVLARQHAPGATYHTLDLNNLESLNEKFDAIFVQAVLLHVPKSDISKTLKNFFKTLHPEGYLYIAVKERRPHEEEEELVTEDDYGYEYSRMFSYFESDELANLLKEAGFTVVWKEAVHAGRTWLQFIAQK